MILRNWSGLVSRDRSVTIAESIWLSGPGCAPSWPAAIWVFCAWSAVTTSPGVRVKLASLNGSSQIRMAYCAPKTVKSPTPGMRAIWSCRFDTR